MNQLEEYLQKMPASETDYPFGPEVTVYKVKGKMFALLSEREGRQYVNLKCQPEDGEILTSQLEGIIPGYHMNKRHWVSVYLDNTDVDESLLYELCDRSYRLVVSKLKKSDRVELENKLE